MLSLINNAWWGIWAIAALCAAMLAWASSIWEWYWVTFSWAGIAFAFLVSWIGLGMGFFLSGLGVSLWRRGTLKLPTTPSEGQESALDDVSRRLDATEHSIAQNASAFEDISSRLAEAERGIAQSKASLDELRTKAAMLARSLRARDAQSIINESDQAIMSTYKKILEEAYPDEAAWANDYAAWERAMSRIDNLMSQWTQQHHKPFLDIRLKDFEASPPPPQHIKSDANATRYKTAWLAQSSYANRRDGIFSYFAAIIRDA
jgi:uncharacterized coiled-coil protein SlyX